MKNYSIVIGLVIFLFLAFSPIIYADGNEPAITSETGKITASVSQAQLTSITDSLSMIAKRDNQVQWVSVVVALSLGLAGIFNLSERIKKRYYERAELKLSIETIPPDCLKIPITDNLGQVLYETYYLRFRVENTGNFKLEDVEIIVSELYRKNTTGRFTKVNQFLPMNLKWANFGELIMPRISPKLFKHCDLGHIIENPSSFPQENQLLQRFGLLEEARAIFILDTQVTPNTGSNYILPGEYKIKIITTASNSAPKDYWYKITIADDWTSEELEMLHNNIKIKRIYS